MAQRKRYQRIGWVHTHAAMGLQFAISTATIVSGAVAERVTMLTYALCELLLTLQTQAFGHSVYLERWTRMCPEESSLICRRILFDCLGVPGETSALSYISRLNSTYISNAPGI